MSPSVPQLNVIRSTILSAVDRMEAHPPCALVAAILKPSFFCPQELDVDAMNARAAVDEINREI